MLHEDLRRLIRKILFLAVLIAGTVIASPQRVGACYDLGQCLDGCDADWWYCHFDCEGYCPNEPYCEVCRDACDNQWFQCYTICFVNPCPR
jgi:hypothetical protein